MIRIKKEKWGLFLLLYKDLGFEYIAPIPQYHVEEHYLNRMYNIDVDSYRRVRAFKNVDNKYSDEFDFILKLERENWLELYDWRDERYG